MGVHSGPTYLIFDRDWVGESSGKLKKKDLSQEKEPGWGQHTGQKKNLVVATSLFKVLKKRKTSEQSMEEKLGKCIITGFYKFIMKFGLWPKDTKEPLKYF